MNPTLTPPSPDFFSLTPDVHYGPGASRRAGEVLAGLGVTHVLVVSDKGVLAAGVADPVLAAVTAAGVRTSVFADIRTNPSEQHVDAAVRTYREQGCDGILGIGGGSALDVAKSAAAVLANGGTILDYEDGGHATDAPTPPLVQVPTTAGTGSEVVAGAIITDSCRVFKMHIVAVPAHAALCDPELTLSLPAGPTAASGIDALAHAVGAYTSSERQPLADAMALHAIRMLAGALPDVLDDGADLDARSRMMTGALTAGISMKGGGAVDHAFAHAVNALFDVHHGVGVALFLGDAMEFNLPHLPQRFADVAVALGVMPGADPVATGRAGIGVVRDLIAASDLPGLRDIGVAPRHVPALAAKVAEDRFHLGLNAVPLSGDDIHRILTDAIGRTS